jgi:hypothetical protein
VHNPELTPERINAIVGVCLGAPPSSNGVHAGDQAHVSNGSSTADEYLGDHTLDVDLDGATPDDAEGDAPLPTINAGNEDLASVTAQAWAALQAANEPPVLFRHGAEPSRIESDDDDAPLVRPLNADRMRHRLARVAIWEKSVERRVGRRTETVVVPAAPPLAVVRDVLATPDPPLPILTRIVEAPIFAADGTLQTEPGYSPAGRTYYAPAPGFTVPAVSAQPSSADVEAARNFILGELLTDFPLTGQGERASAVACLLLPFVRDMIDGPTPLHMFEAPSPGTGKTLLVDLLTFPALGRPVAAMTEGKDEDEWRKRVFAKLRSGPSIVLIDNLKRRLESGAISSAITAWPLWEDRVLGFSEIARVPVRCVWLATGNNVAVSNEIARRTVRCRLDAKQDRPWLRDGFRHPDIRRWVQDHRAELVGSALTLIQAWICAGRPEGDKTLGMFESWARTMGGILGVAGIPGFLGNLEEFYERADTDTAAWSAFIASWWFTKGYQEAKAGDLWTLAVDAGLDLGEKGEQSQKTRLGRLLREKRDRVFVIGTGDDAVRLRLQVMGEFRGVKQWQLQKAVVGATKSNGLGTENRQPPHNPTPNPTPMEAF